MKKLKHLSEIYDFYDAFIIDLWGVMHNGINLYPNAMEVVENLTKNNKKITFLSNAPRPNKDVINFLKKLKMEEKYLKKVLTSGEAATRSLKKNEFGIRFFHLGPERDSSLFAGLEKNKTSIENSDFILCTGLFENFEDDLNYYKKLLTKHVKKKFICTNPDLIVHRGNEEEYCAGKIAELFESLGGKVIYFGKPHKEIYDICLKRSEKTLVIGDNLNTDIKGANNLKLDSLFITDGVHKVEYKNENEIDTLLKKYKVDSKYFQNNLYW